jgi:polysaccharide export outer membrane protein
MERDRSMRMMTHSLFGPRRCNMLAAALLATACLSAQAQYAGPAVTPATGADAPLAAMHISYVDAVIVPGDVISITTYGAPELTIAATTSTGSLTTTAGAVGGMKVGGLGEVTLPFLGTVKLAGMTPAQASAYLRKALLDGGFLADPQVIVGLVESPTRVITVLGEVARPSPVPAFGQLRLMDAISACGGFTPLASHTVTVHRRGVADPITVDLGVDPKAANLANIPLLPGDTVVVSKVGNIFVVGEVKTVSSFPAATNAPITVMRAIAMAGGLRYSAALSKARIIRTSADNQRIEIDLDLKKLMQGKQQDVALAANDILFVPANTFKAVVAAGGVGVAESLFYGATYAEATLK